MLHVYLFSLSKMLSTENREAIRICDSREKTLGFKHFSMPPFQ